MKKTILILGLVGILIILAVYLNPFKQNNSSTKPTFIATSTPVTPSKTLKSYTDPSGFSFSYPDNLSLLNNELKDKNSYAELQLAAKGVDGSLVIKIADSKLTSLDEWVKANKTDSDTTKEVKLGNLKGWEITAKDKVMLGALDQGVLFNIEVPKDKNFWRQVYQQVLESFSFVSPTQDTTSEDNVSFEGEEVVE